MPAGWSEILTKIITASSKGKPNIMELLMSFLLELKPIPCWGLKFLIFIRMNKDYE